MKYLVFDLETNDRDAFVAEPIDGAFAITDENFNIIDTHRFLSKIDKWSDEAEKVHGISRDLMLTYPEKGEAYNELFKFLSKHKPYRVCCYSNPNNFGNYFHYDTAVIKLQLNIIYGNHTLYYMYFNDDIFSPYNIIRELVKNKKLIITPNSDPEITLYSMENVYLNLFGETYNAHRSIDDTKALLKICKYLLKLKHEKNYILFNAIESGNRKKEKETSNTQSELL